MIAARAEVKAFARPDGTRRLDASNRTLKGRVQMVMLPGAIVRIFARCCIGFLCLGLGAGCAHVKVLHRERGLQTSHFAEGKLGIAAVGGLGGGEYFLSENVAKALSERLAVTHPEIAVVGLTKIKRLLPETEYQAFLREFSEVPSVRMEDWELLSRLSSKVRYLVLISISGDENKEWESQSSETSQSYTKNSKTGKWESETVTDSYTSTRSISRTVEMSFFIYDLKARRPVWVAVGNHTGSSHSQSSSLTPFVSSPPWPGAPSSMEPIEAIVKRAVSKLPR